MCHLHAGKFFWVDREHLGADDLTEFCKCLQLPANIIQSVVHAAPRSSFAVIANAGRAVAPAAVDTRPSDAWLNSNYVTLVLTEQFLLCVHVAPCAPLQDGRQRYRALGALDLGTNRGDLMAAW